MPIQSKKKPVIQKGSGYCYNPATFAKEHKVPFFHVVSTAEELMEKVKPCEMFGFKFITFDTETHPYYSSSTQVPESATRRWVGSGKSASPQDYPFCISICDGTNSFTLFDSIENKHAIMKKLAPLLEDPTVAKVAHNTKFDMHQLANAGMKLVGRLHDTVVLCKLTDENRKSYMLRDVAAKYKEGIVKFEYMVDDYKQMHKVTDYRDIPRELLAEYANADVWNCFQAFVHEYPKLAEEGLQAVYDNECELMIALYAMERYGMKIDLSYEAELKEDLQRLADEAERAIYEEAGGMFNINSTKQLYSVLLKLGVSSTLIGMTDKGNPKLDKDALNNLAEVHNVSIVKKILEFRKYDKLLTTYAIGIYSQRDASDRVHGSINQTEATTGRMSITKPALQTLPKKDKRIRRAFIPEENHTMYFFDLDQVEYRLFAHYAKIPWLINAIKEGYDVHAATAALLTGSPMDKFMEAFHAGEQWATDARVKAKTINFALIYGVGISHLGELLNVSETEATSLRASYFSNLPEAKVFIATVQQVIKERGYVKNYYGRRRRLTADEGYKGPNALIQGCAADYIKFKIVKMYKYMMYYKLKTHMTNVVHDEVVINFHNDELEHAPVIRWLMSEFTDFRCPITAGSEVGNPSWGQKEEADIGFKEPDSYDFLNYDVYNGDVFNIYKEA